MRILLVEDDVLLCRNIELQLTKNGYAVDACHDGEEGLYFARQKAYDLILLDRMLPGMDGLTLLQVLRRESDHTPVLMLTALDGIGDRVDGLDAGADDYLTKPFATEELLARIRAMLRRTPELKAENLIVCGDVRFDLEGRLLTGPAGSRSLSKREAGLLELLLKNPGATLTRAQLFFHVWGASSEVEEANLDVYIRYVRLRLSAVGSRMQVKTVRGTGYRLEAVPC